MKNISGLSSLLLALTCSLPHRRRSGDPKPHGHLRPPVRQRAGWRQAPCSRRRAAPCRAEEHGAGHPAEREQQRRDGLCGLLDGRTDGRAAGERRKVRILPCRRALRAIDGIERQIEGARTGSNATVAESQRAVQRATSCLYVLGARAGDDGTTRFDI